MARKAEQDASNGYNQGDCIIEPVENDVLCGRGGMSNHHPGNEWYRRLIRSNRPLYRACPKHTKLLVSKAIVQAVQEQGGRFLERSRKNGMWYPVQYKRAVDKTSQGLRERERDDPPGNDEDSSLASSLPKSSKSRRRKNGEKVSSPNLKALAKVAMAKAGIEPTTSSLILPRRISNINNNNNSSNSSYNKKKNSNGTNSNKNSSSMTKKQIAASRQWQQEQQPQNSQQQIKIMEQQQLQAMQIKNNAKNDTIVDDNDDELEPISTSNLEPLPPTLQIRQSSMFRLFDNSKTSSRAAVKMEETKASETPVSVRLMNNNNEFGNSFTNSNTNFKMQNEIPQQRDLGSTGPPAFTRLTTQVSDWLNSFWPLHGSAPMGVNNNNKMENGRGSKAENTMSGSDNKYTAMRQHQQQNPSNNMAFDSSGLVSNSLSDTSSLQPSGAMQNNLEELRRLHQKTNNVNRESFNPGSLPGNNTFAMDMQARMELLRNSNKQVTATDTSKASVAPTSLEHSVSASLMKLASAPSNIIASISSIFTSPAPPQEPPNKNQKEISFQEQQLQQQQQLQLQIQQQQQQLQLRSQIQQQQQFNSSIIDSSSTEGMMGYNKNNAGPNGIVNGRNSSGKRTSKSLLDDYEESPMEARLRNPASGSTIRASSSLLDDYDETPMEKRLRTVR